MKNKVLSTTLLTALAAQSPAFAASAVEIAGVVEVEATHHTPYAGDSSSDIAVATVELGIAGEINPNLVAELVLLHEEDDTPLEVDVASLIFAPKDSAFSVVAGQIYVPFGHFHSNMVSDPLTLEIGETRESALQMNMVAGAMTTSLYLFNGDNKQNAGADDSVDNFGISLAYQTDSLAINLGYMNDIGDSDSLQGLINETLGSNDVQQHVAGTSISAVATLGKLNLVAEYVSASDQFDVSEIAFNGVGAQPSAMNLEIGYGFEMAGKTSSIAVAQQSTEESLALGLPETRTAATLSVEVMENSALSFELAQDSDYDTADGGTGETAKTLTIQFATEF